MSPDRKKSILQWTIKFVLIEAIVAAICAVAIMPVQGDYDSVLMKTVLIAWVVAQVLLAAGFVYYCIYMKRAGDAEKAGERARLLLGPTPTIPLIVMLLMVMGSLVPRYLQKQRYDREHKEWEAKIADMQNQLDVMQRESNQKWKERLEKYDAATRPASASQP